mmetsp:Transcript_4482/g.10965  ORF Transcript_4482/g.10965 Transcript_4482/m.10965 type:complete len:315 (+) Transcript_4482:215-1159(+)
MGGGQVDDTWEKTGAAEGRRGRRREAPTATTADEEALEARQAPRKRPRDGGGGDGDNTNDANDDKNEEEEGDDYDAPFSIMGGKGEVLARCMVDSSQLWVARDIDALRATLHRDGYLLLRGMLPRADVEAARAAALAALAAERPHLFAAEAGSGNGNDSNGNGGTTSGDGSSPPPPLNGLLVPGASNLGLLSRQHIAAMPEVRAVVEADALFDLAEALLDCSGVSCNGGSGGGGGGGELGCNVGGRGGEARQFQSNRSDGILRFRRGAGADDSAGPRGQRGRAEAERQPGRDDDELPRRARRQLRRQPDQRRRA